MRILDIYGIFDPQRYPNNLYLINVIHIFMVKISFCCSCKFDYYLYSFADFYLFFFIYDSHSFNIFISHKFHFTIKVIEDCRVYSLRSLSDVVIFCDPKC